MLPSQEYGEEVHGITIIMSPIGLLNIFSIIYCACVSTHTRLDENHPYWFEGTIRASFTATPFFFAENNTRAELGKYISCEEMPEASISSRGPFSILFCRWLNELFLTTIQVM